MYIIYFKKTSRSAFHFSINDNKGFFRTRSMMFTVAVKTFYGRAIDRLLPYLQTNSEDKKDVFRAGIGNYLPENRQRKTVGDFNFLACFQTQIDDRCLGCIISFGGR
jgi:hypothetical protein